MNATPRAKVDRERELRPANLEQVAKLDDVEQADRGCNDDRREDRLWHRLDETGARRGASVRMSTYGHQAGQLRLAPHWGGHGRLGAARAQPGNPEYSLAARSVEPDPRQAPGCHTPRSRRAWRNPPDVETVPYADQRDPPTRRRKGPGCRRNGTMDGPCRWKPLGKHADHSTRHAMPYLSGYLSAIATTTATRTPGTSVERPA